MANASGSSVLTLKLFAFFLVNNVGTQNTPVCGIVKLERKPTRSDLKSRDPNILQEPLVDKTKIIPLMHMKLSLMKQFVKTLPTDGE